MIPVSQGKPCAGNPHARFEEGASAQAEPRRSALLHNTFGLVGMWMLREKRAQGRLPTGLSDMRLSH